MTLEAQLDLSVGGLQLQAELKLNGRETMVVLGPPGAGKTILVRALAGLIKLRSGQVTLDGRVLEDSKRRLRVRPESRSISTVFQDRLLFPHLNVLDNVAFGLRARGMPRHQAQAEALNWLARIDLASWAAQIKPQALTAGQIQKVALARALAPSPRLLLLDEPLVAADTSSKAATRRELQEHLKEFDGSRLIVTRDPVEAMVLADRLVILEGGRVVQTDSPTAVAERPRSRYVADVAGINLLRGVCRDDKLELHGGGNLSVVGAPPGEVFAVIHPRAVSLWRQAPQGTPRNVWSGVIGNLDQWGNRVRVKVEGRPNIVAEVTQAAISELHLEQGGEVWVSVKATEPHVYPA